MGVLFGRHKPDRLAFHPVNRSLKHQTFNIQGQLYTLHDRIGKGTYGSVWSAITPDGRSAAIKTIDVLGSTSGNGSDALSSLKSFQKEIEMAYRMRQETRHVVTIYGYDFDPRFGLALISMELGSDSLTQRIAKLHKLKSPITEDYIPSYERKNIWKQLVDIVLTLHRYHVIHRDINPDNLVFFGSTMKIIDLGIAQNEMIEHDPFQTTVGTPYFSAPECFVEGTRITSKADIWSAGAILYYMTYGEAPLYSSARPPPDGRLTRSPYVKDVLDKCLQRVVYRRKVHRWLAQHPYTTDSSTF